MRILLLGEYSNVHATLAEGLRQMGHDVTVVSNGDFWKDYPRDIDVSRQPGHWGGLKLLMRVARLLPRLRGYDVVQLINPMFLELKACRLFPIYRYLRRHNSRMVLCAMGMDYYWVSECTYRKPMRYSDFNMGDQVRTDEPALREQRDWIGTDKERLNRMIANDCDGIIAGLYDDYVCYQPHFPQKLHFIPLPIKNLSQQEKPCNAEADIPDLEKKIPTDATMIRLFIGISRGRSAYKGTDIMLQAAEDVQQRYPDRLEIVKAEGVPFAQYQHMMDHCDVMMDQLYSYTPAMNALLAMSKWIVVIGGGEPEGYNILNEVELRPIINVEPSFESVRQALEDLVVHPERLQELKRQSKEYVKRHHDYLKVAAAYDRIYRLILFNTKK